MPRLVRILGTLLAAAGVFVLAGLLGGHAASSAATQALRVVEQNNPAFTPFQVELAPKTGFCQTVAVPAGKRLVIEHVSARIETPADREISITTTAGGATAPHWFLLSEPFVTISIASQDARLYADPGTEVRACVQGLGQVTLSGHLVSLAG
jgi:hypothetical protein